MTIEFKRKLMNTGSFILGFGLLGAVDGIVFHQLLQWHSVYMNTHRHGQIITDGLFHTFTVIALLVGAVLLWKAGHPKDIEKGNRMLLSGIFMGGGVFNLVEGIIDHHILQIHHVKQGDPNQLAYDLAFLASGAILLFIGILMRRNAEDRDSIELNRAKEKMKAH